MIDWLMAIWLILILPAGIAAAYTNTFKQHGSNDSFWLSSVCLTALAWPVFILLYSFFLTVEAIASKVKHNRAEKDSLVIVKVMNKK